MGKNYLEKLKLAEHLTAWLAIISLLWTFVAVLGIVFTENYLAWTKQIIASLLFFWLFDKLNDIARQAIFDTIHGIGKKLTLEEKMELLR